MRLSVVRLATIVVLATAGTTQAQGIPRITDFRSGFVVSGDWLQANALPLDRDALHSGDVVVSYRRAFRGMAWSVDAGGLRIARSLSNVNGGFAGVGPLFDVLGVVVHPALDVLVGKGEASVDSTGYDFITPAGAVGHQAQFSYSSAATVGVGGTLTVEVPVYRMIALHLSAAQWFFSGQPLSLDRNRTLLGLGLSLRVAP